MNKPHVNADCTSAVVDFVLRRRPEALPRLLWGLEELAGVPEKNLRRLLCGGGEVPAPVLLEMLRRAREDIFLDPRIGFLIGFEMVAFQHWDPARAFFLRVLGTPVRAARALVWLGSGFARVVSSEKVIDLTASGCRISIHWNPAVGLNRDLCLFYQGGLAAGALAWGGEPIEINEKSCSFTDGESCELELAWEPFAWRDRLRALSMYLPAVRRRFLVETMRRHSPSLDEANSRLRRVEASFKAMITAAHDAIIEIMPDGAVNSLNQAALDLAGAESYQTVMRIQEMVPPEDLPILMDRHRRRLAGDEVPNRYPFRVLRTDGSVVPVEGSFSLLEDPQRGKVVLGILRDVRLEQAMARALEEERQRFMRLADFSPLGLAIIDAEGRYLYLNPTFTQLFGYDLGDFQTGRQWFRLAFPDPDYRHGVAATWKRDLAELGPGRMRPQTFRVVCRDGSTKDVLFRPVSLDRGEQIVVFEDVTERLGAEKALRESAARLSTIVEGSPDAILLLDHKRQILQANRQAQLLPGGETTLPGRDLAEVLPPDLDEKFKGLWQRLMAEGKVSEELSAEASREDEAPAWEVTGLVLGPKLVHLSLRDIGARRRQEAEKRQAARLGGVVELAGAAAHELNQPLTSLLASLEMMAIYQDPANLQRLAGKARAEVDRLSELVARLGKIVRYESQPYLGQTRIIDIKKSSQED